MIRPVPLPLSGARPGAGIQQECLGYIGDIEAAMVKEFPYDVPSEWKNLPQLKVCTLHLACLACMYPGSRPGFRV